MTIERSQQPIWSNTRQEVASGSERSLGRDITKRHFACMIIAGRISCFGKRKLACFIVGNGRRRKGLTLMSNNHSCISLRLQRLKVMNSCISVFDSTVP